MMKKTVKKAARKRPLKQGRQTLTATDTKRLIEAALAEDIGPSDITTEAIVPRDLKGRCRIVAKGEFVVAGLDAARDVFKTLDSKIVFRKRVRDGEVVKRGVVIAEVSGTLRTILSAERVALNFLQRLSGTATAAREYSKRVGKTGIKVLDTRKTTPCMRALERYAVRVGGCFNHRWGLYDSILIKDNHVKIAGSVREAIKRVRRAHTKTTAIEVEAKNLAQACEAADCGADIIMLDNMGIEKIKKAIKAIGGKALVEVSGGVTAREVRAIAKAGANFISTGFITHSAPAADLSLDVITDGNPRR